MKKITIIKPFIPSMSNAIEIWLTKMALNGFALVSISGWKFTFIESSPRYREYCIYSGFGASKGIWADYYLVKQLCSNTKTKLSNDSYRIFEIDENKDKQTIHQFKKLRKRYYFKHYFSMLILTLFFSSILFGLTLVNNYCLILFLCYIVFVLYHLVSLVLVCKTRDK